MLCYRALRVEPSNSGARVLRFANLCRLSGLGARILSDTDAREIPMATQRLAE